MEISSDSDLIAPWLERSGWTGRLSPQAEQTLRLCSFAPREYLFRSGEEMSYFHVYVEGKAKVYRTLENGQIMLVRFYKPFQILGDIELFSGGEAISSVQALTRVRTLRLPMEAVRRELEGNNPLLRLLAEGLARKLAAFNATSAVNMNYSLETRLASYLVLIYLDGDDYRESREELETENLGELSEFLGCSYRHLTRTLEGFKKKGILTKKGRTIIIHDPEALKRISQDVFQTETGNASG